MLFSIDTLKSYAHSVGITNIDDDALKVLSQDLEYRIKEICQEGSKFMLASKRSKLSIEDINYGLISRNVDPLFGYDPHENLVFKGLPSGIYYVPDEEIDLEDFLERPLPKIPLNPSIQSHWLAIEGVQPQTAQNPIVIEKVEQKKDTLLTYQEDTELKTQNRHMLTKELSMYFEKIIQAMETEEDIAIECLKNESGIQQLVPYFIHHFNQQIMKNLKNSIKLKTVLMMYNSLLRNQFIFIDVYLHQVLPSLLTCVVGKHIDESVRYMSADVIKYVYQEFAIKYKTLGPRIVRTLVKSWFDKNADECVHLGAVHCLSILSKEVINSVIKPKFEIYKKEIGHKSVIEKINFLLQQ